MITASHRRTTNNRASRPPYTITELPSSAAFSRPPPQCRRRLDHAAAKKLRRKILKSRTQPLHLGWLRYLASACPTSPTAKRRAKTNRNLWMCVRPSCEGYQVVQLTTGVSVVFYTRLGDGAVCMYHTRLSFGIVWTPTPPACLSLLSATVCCVLCFTLRRYRPLLPRCAPPFFVVWLARRVPLPSMFGSHHLVSPVTGEVKVCHHTLF